MNWAVSCYISRCRHKLKLNEVHSTALNLLTTDVVLEASKEIQTGIHVQLDWSMHQPHHPAFGRLPIQHRVKDMSSEGFVGLDDEIHINTQTSSQWDSLKHVSRANAPYTQIPVKCDCLAMSVSMLTVQHSLASRNRPFFTMV